MLLGGNSMIWYRIGESLIHTESAPRADVPALVLLTTEELEKRPDLPGLEKVLEHTPSVRGARTCRAEVRPDCLSGTLVLPRKGKDGVRAAYGLLVTRNRIVLTDDPLRFRPSCTASRRKNDGRRERSGRRSMISLNSSLPVICIVWKSWKSRRKPWRSRCSPTALILSALR